MKFLVSITALALALTSTVTAQASYDAIASSIPSCAQSCLPAGASRIGCQSKDYACQCKSTAAIQSAVEPCILSGCGLASALQLAPLATQLCACAAAAAATPTRASMAVRGARAAAALTTLVTATVG